MNQMKSKVFNISDCLIWVLYFVVVLVWFWDSVVVVFSPLIQEYNLNHRLKITNTSCLISGISSRYMIIK